MDRAAIPSYVSRIREATGDFTSDGNWILLLRECSEADVIGCLEYMERRRDSVRNPGAYLNTLLRSVVGSNRARS